VSLDLILTEGAEEIVKEDAGQIAGDDGLVQSDEDGMARLLGLVVALVEHAIPCAEQAQGGRGVGNLIAQVVRHAAEGVEALEVGTNAFG